jgi:glycosyltransferase involved in cell wall biosynthesis
MNNITSGLIKLGHEVKLLTIFTQKHDLDFDILPDEYVTETGIEGVFVDTSINLADAFSSLITRDSYNISRFFSPDFDMRLTYLLRRQKFDVIHLESLFMTPYIASCRRNSHAQIVLRSHNLEFIIWERMAAGAKGMAKRAYLKYLSRKLREYELSVIDEVDGIASISPEDKTKYQELGGDKPMTTIPFGIDINNYPLDSAVEPEISLFHLGSLDWTPNLEGVLWFLDEVWSKLSKEFPNLKLYLAGRNIPDDLLPAKTKNIEIVGEVDDAKEFMRSKAIMIVPLLSASGIRVKIIEGMALGKAIVSTKIGAEGLDVVQDEHIMLAESGQECADAISQLINDPEKLKQIGASARKLVETTFDNNRISQKLEKFYKELIGE